MRHITVTDVEHLSQKYEKSAPKHIQIICNRLFVLRLISFFIGNTDSYYFVDNNRYRQYELFWSTGISYSTFEVRICLHISYFPKYFMVSAKLDISLNRIPSYFWTLCQDLRTDPHGRHFWSSSYSPNRPFGW